MAIQRICWAFVSRADEDWLCVGSMTTARITVAVALECNWLLDGCLIEEVMPIKLIKLKSFAGTIIRVSPLLRRWSILGC